MWIVDVPGPKPDGENPPWIRLRRISAQTSEADVLDLLKETAAVHRCARAMQGGVEISVYGRYFAIVRQLSVVAENADDGEDGHLVDREGP